MCDKQTTGTLLDCKIVNLQPRLLLLLYCTLQCLVVVITYQMPRGQITIQNIVNSCQHSQVFFQPELNLEDMHVGA